MNAREDEKILGKITKRFSKFRSAGGGRRYPLGLKSMAITAVSGGLRKTSVSRAAGIAPSLLYTWLAEVPKVKRLNLVESTALSVAVAPGEMMACIRLGSGVEINIPRSELNGEFLATLSALGRPQ